MFYINKIVSSEGVNSITAYLYTIKTLEKRKADPYGPDLMNFKELFLSLLAWLVRDFKDIEQLFLFQRKRTSGCLLFQSNIKSCLCFSFFFKGLPLCSIYKCHTKRVQDSNTWIHSSNSTYQQVLYCKIDTKKKQRSTLRVDLCFLYILIIT